MMTRRNPDLEELIGDARWLAHRYDETEDAIQFRLVPREAQRNMTFLIDAEVGDAPLAVRGRAECLIAASELNLPVPRMIFHSAYCCSTLLARAFDVPGVSFGFKEPQILNDVVGLQIRRADPRQIAAALDVALTLLARPLGPGEVSVIKPSNLLNPSLPLIGAMRPGIRSLLLYAPLDVFLASIARKEIEGRAWVRELMWKLIQLGQAERFGLSSEELFRQTDLQTAAVGWLAQHALFAEATQANGECRTLDSETLLNEPAKCLDALSALFDLDFDGRAVAAGPAFRTHSKDRSDYSADRRKKDQERGRSVHAREIEAVTVWSERLAEHAGIAMRPPAPLLGSSA